MIKGLLGKKLGMTQIFTETGELVPVTVLEAGPCVVLQIKTDKTDGYTAVQLGFDQKKPSRTNKPDTGRFKKAKSQPVRFVSEVKAESVDDIKIADTFSVDLFEVGDYVDVTGRTIGKGFQGGVKRWNWSRGPMSHGSMSHRAPGSIGVTDPPRVVKGHHMPGHMGNARLTTKNVEVVEIDKDQNLLLVKGSVPGAKDNYLVINRSYKKKKEIKEGAIQEKKMANPLKQSKKSMRKK
jgi:large subunit ribosomal protein L3